MSGTCFICAFECKNEETPTSSAVNLNEIKNLNNNSSQENLENQKDKKASAAPSDDNKVNSLKEVKEVFYVTKTGKCFHKKGCRYLKRLKMCMNLEKARKKYKPCKNCIQV